MYLLLLLLFSIQFKHHFFWIILGAVGCLLHGHLTVPYTTCILIACHPANPALFCILYYFWLLEKKKKNGIGTTIGSHRPEVLLLPVEWSIHYSCLPRLLTLVLPQPSKKRIIEVSLACKRHQIFTSGSLPGDSLTWDFSSYSPSNFPSNKRFSVLLNSSKEANYAE